MNDSKKNPIDTEHCCPGCSGRCPLVNDPFPGGGSPLSSTPDTVFDTTELTPAFAEIKKRSDAWREEDRVESEKIKKFLSIINPLAVWSAVILFIICMAEASSGDWTTIFRNYIAGGCVAFLLGRLFICILLNIPKWADSLVVWQRKRA